MNENDNNADSIVTEADSIFSNTLIFSAAIINPSSNANDSTISYDKPLISNQTIEAVPVQVIKSQDVVAVLVPTEDNSNQLPPQSEKHGFNYLKRKYIILDRHHHYLHNQPDFYQVEQ